MTTIGSGFRPVSNHLPATPTAPTAAPTTAGPVGGAVAKDVFVGAAGTKSTLPGNDYVGANPTGFPLFDQDVVATDPNACGTTSLSMILASQGVIGRDLASAQAVDHAVRPWGGFSAPRDLMQYAESKGLHSQSSNNASFSDLENRLKAGNSVQCMVDGGGSPHWVVAMGTYTDPATGEKHVKVGQPGGGRVEDLTQAQFEKIWKAPNESSGSFVNNLMGYHNYMIAYDKDASKLGDGKGNFGLATTETIADGVSDVANSWSMLKEGRVPAAFGSAVGGVVKTLGAVPGAIGNAINVAGDSVLDKGLDMINKPGVGNKVGGALLTAGGAVVKGVGVVGSAVGNVVSSIGDAVGSGIKKLFSWW